ncbi:variant erythrocyte surface antigen-1 family protein [Babesia caballi]|uniref:Variant erythrocyte surface antigen-1 family protein n=1 Tax=Babesia caballi TaxID=5871 RepID=A0AAV4LTB2_BABCB|nr:variant erythrocyte surface antigen-1 family protein [Babesia caballi]
MDRNGNGYSNSGKLKEAVDKMHNFSTATKPVGTFYIDGLFNSVAKALQHLIGYDESGGRELKGNGIGRKDQYASSYSGQAKWEANLNVATSNEAQKAANIFLGSMPMVYYFVTYLYFKCTVGRDGWSGERLNGTYSGLKNFMIHMGFPSEQLNGPKTGSGIAKLLEDEPNGFDGLKIVDRTENSYETFLNNLKKEYGESTLVKSAITCPLYTLYLAAMTYLKSTLQSESDEESGPNLKEIKEKLKSFKRACKAEQYLEDGFNKFLTDIHLPTSNSSHSSGTSDEDSPSPGGPVAGTLTTFGLGGGAAAAYLFNLGGAKALVNGLLRIGWILRVTGKDGQDSSNGQQAIKALSTQVKQLLREVKGTDTGLSAQIEKVTGALDSDPNGLITKLAEGLQQFIGYEGGMLSDGSTTKLTGGGILLANVAKYQVCNAVLNFVIRFLEGLLGIQASGHGEVLKVIATLRKCVGTGKVPNGFEQLVGKIGEKVDGISKKVLKNTQGKLKNVFDEFKKICDHYNGQLDSGQKVEAKELDNFLNAVESALHRDNSGYFATYCERLKELLENNELKGKEQKNDAALTYSELESNIKGVTDATTNLNNDIRGINNMPEKANLIPNAAVFTAVRDAATAFVAEIKEPGKYTSYYKGAAWSKVSSDNNAIQKCAKIFLGCLPLYYQALTYIYWGCHEKGGGCGNLTLAGGAMRFYFDSQGFLSPYVDRSKTGAHVAESALKGFSELQAAASSLSTTESPYASFTTKLQENVGKNSNNLPSTCPLSALFYGASCYFRYQQITTVNIANGAPKTIREMLYFLAALQFSPQYETFDGYVTSHFKTILNKPSRDITDDSELKLQVADSGTSATGNTLSAADLKSYLTSTFHLAPAFIGLVQEPSTSDDPWLHSLFSNSKFNLSIPSSGPGIFSALSNYTYALQFQLSFLYIQCRNTYTVGCGWQECKFGQGINSDPQSQIVQSHICSVGCSATNHNSGDHASGNCEHAKCGEDTNGSPLQAFLTDKLRGFSRGHPSDPSSHLATCSGVLCHVPMGFDSHLRHGSLQGGHIAYALGSFCGGFNTPLRQLSEKLGCLTKRTPRTLGDMFGFTWHLKGQLYNQRNAEPARHNWVTKLANLTPFSSTVMEHINVLKTFVGTGHTDPHDTADLTSLYSSGCNQQNQNCGPYLYPLTHSDGTTFGKAAPYASTYLSWVLYLTDELYESLQEFLDTFNGHACKGCKHKCSHSTGSAATGCSCPSVVDCADVLPLLYRHGFRFLSAFRLKGGKGRSDKSKRSCQNFHSQLQSVINGEPLRDLFESIDTFLYAIRWEFFSKLSAFWTIYVCLILYTFFFLLDTLRVRSHLKLTSSHTVPPLALLTSGTPLPVTKLTYIGH